MKQTLLTLAAVLCAGFLAAAPAEISVNIKLDHTSYLVGERVRAIVDVRNMTADVVAVGYDDAEDRFLLEVYRASDRHQLPRTSDRPFVSPFLLKANEGTRLETFVGDRYEFANEGRFLVKPVLVHKGMRFEGLPRAFDIVPGMPVTQAVQQYSNRPGLSRIFDLLRWPRRGTDHLFLAARDEGPSERRWVTIDLGPMMRITKPVISILPSGEVIVIHRNGPDSFARSSFWSLTDRLCMRGQEMVRDPETAGQQRVQEMYRQNGGVTPVDRPWWKFW